MNYFGSIVVSIYNYHVTVYVCLLIDVTKTLQVKVYGKKGNKHARESMDRR